MTRQRSGWLLPALAALLLIAAACSAEASGTPDDGERERGPGTAQSAGSGADGDRGTPADATDDSATIPPSPGNGDDAVHDPAEPKDRDASGGGNGASPAPDDPVSDGDAATPGTPRGSDEPADPGHDLPVEPELAPIDELDLEVMESYPVQYALRIVSGLPSGCASYSHTDVERDGNTITVEVWNHVVSDPDVACTMIYGMHEQSVHLGDDFDPGEEYTVRVNGEVLTFTTQ